MGWTSLFCLAVGVAKDLVEYATTAALKKVGIGGDSPDS